MTAIVTFPIAVGLFACLGWSIPFTLWGLIVSTGKEHPDWSALLDAIGALLFVMATVAVLGGAWWVIYTLVRQINTAPSGR